MEYLKEINSLDKLPDAQIVGRKVIDGQQGAVVFIIGPLARALGYEETVVVKWLPIDYIDTVETILEAEGYSVSRA